jgi:hypothetical protein
MGINKKKHKHNWTQTTGNLRILNLNVASSFFLPYAEMPAVLGTADRKATVCNLLARNSSQAELFEQPQL